MLPLQWFGLPPKLGQLLSKVATATSEYYHLHQTTSDVKHEGEPDTPEHIEQLEQELITYKAEDVEIRDSQGDSPFGISGAEMSVAQEIWRLTGHILLDHLVRQREMSHAKLQNKVQDLIALLQAVMVLSASRLRNNGTFLDFWTGYYTGPAFLGGSLAMETDDRRFFTRFLREMGPEQALGGLLNILEATWAASDAIGCPADWFQVAKRIEEQPCFF